MGRVYRGLKSPSDTVVDYTRSGLDEDPAVLVVGDADAPFRVGGRSEYWTGRCRPSFMGKNPVVLRGVAPRLRRRRPFRCRL